MNNSFDELTMSLAQSVTRRLALKEFGVGLAEMALGTVMLVAFAQAGPPMPPVQTRSSIPCSEIGVKAGADGKGDSLAVSATTSGARFHCAFQRLNGEATLEGLWLTSTAPDQPNDRFRVVATGVGRDADSAGRSRCDVPACVAPSGTVSPLHAARTAQRAVPANLLPASGDIFVNGRIVRFNRPGLTEEYTVSRDGVRQDFVLLERPVGAGELVVGLAVSGAKVEPAADGARLVLENSGRKIAYSRLRVTDATGKELTARMEVKGSAAAPVAPVNAALTGGTSEQELGLDSAVTTGRVSDEGVEHDTRGACAPTLAVQVDDSDAVYPVRIDPTFSDANWISMNPSIEGADNNVSAAEVDGSGNLYIGGIFTVVSDVAANNIAKWNGNSWSALGSGMNGAVHALAVSGSDLYAGGRFGAADGDEANHIAKWNGSYWSALGSGMSSGGDDHPSVYALAVSGSNVYAGGEFDRAGEVSANNIAKWNGSSWSALSLGVNDPVWALAVSGSNLYAGGEFTGAVGSEETNYIPANSIAKWDGSRWSTLGAGMNDSVYALAVSGSNLYAGGSFTTAGGVAAYHIAKWDGSSWSALGSGMNDSVSALAVSGGNLYAGGRFTTAGGSQANFIAKWDGSGWTPLGSGMNNHVSALAVSGSDLYPGGSFTTAGGKVSAYVARAYLPTLPTLSMLRSGTDVMVSWPSVDTAGFALEQAGTLAAPTSWVTNTASITDDGTNKSVTLQATNSAQFFRLRGP